jgi:hypothetical protein
MRVPCWMRRTGSVLEKETKLLGARLGLSQGLRFWQLCWWWFGSSGVWHYIRWVVPDISKDQSTFFFKSQAGQEGWSALLEAWSWRQYDPSNFRSYSTNNMASHLKCQIILNVFFDDSSGTLCRRAKSQVLGLFRLFKAWMQTCYADSRDALAVIEGVSDICCNLAAGCL